MSNPKIFIGTMYSGEGDYDLCCQRIKEQVGVTVHHHVISNLTEKQAHNELWNSWNDNRSLFDFFVKIDADTVLRDRNTLLEISNQLSSSPRVTGIQAPLHDYMTDSLINGLNCFSKQVQFNLSTDDLYCDRNVDYGHDVVLRDDNLPMTLRPAGYHCYNTTDLQAFHYGVHRSLKNQTHIIERVRSIWNVQRDRTRWLALAGASASKNFNITNHNYTDDFLKEMFEATKASYANQTKSSSDR